MEVFPDLHHKMSKKIAQLTKVIYHLNTKNEDHMIEIDQINSNHQLEIQQILRDAANRISKFKEAIESKQQSVRIHVFCCYFHINKLHFIRLMQRHK
jgi:methionine synthase II (cobalamin-independent)